MYYKYIYNTLFMLNFRYVSLLRQRSTTTTVIPEDRSIGTTTKDNFEEPIENKNTKVSYEAFTTESNIISTELFSNEPYTEMITTTINTPTFTDAKDNETAKIVTSFTEKNIDTISTIKTPIPVTTNISNIISTTKAPTSTITNVITSIYEAATERQRVRVKNIQNFLSEHKKTEPVTQTITRTTMPLTTTSFTTLENTIANEEPTQKSLLRGRFGGQVHFRPTLRKPINSLDKSITTTEKINETTTEKIVETTTEKKSRLNKYSNRFIRPASNSTESTSITGRRFIRTTTENTVESNSKQFNRLRQTTSSDVDNSTPLSKRSFSRFRTSTTSETPLISSTELQKSRFFRSRKPILSITTSTTTIGVTTMREILNSEDNVDNVQYETTYAPTTINFPLTNYEETSTNDKNLKTTTIESFEPTKYTKFEITTIQPTTSKIAKTFRGAVRANNGFEDNIEEKTRSPSSARHNSRFLKDEQKILFIRVLPSPDGRSQNDFTSTTIKNLTRNRGKIRAFDSLELNTLNDGLTNNDRPNELFRGSETNFRVQQSTTTKSTEEV